MIVYSATKQQFVNDVRSNAIAALIQDYSETVRNESIALLLCAYLHNMKARDAITDDGSLWLIAENSVEQIGCMHTCQPLEHPSRDKALSGIRGRLKKEPEAALIAADGFSDRQDLENVGNPEESEWVQLPEHINTTKGMFVTRVVGESMNKRIINGSWCLFKANPSGSRNGKNVLVEHCDIEDPDHGGTYTVKTYHSEKIEEDGVLVNQRIAYLSRKLMLMGIRRLK
tara:strand:+ start:2289 stop:2972 length:684 start_codon:yes stop_codon:yes gene_type:complete